MTITIDHKWLKKGNITSASVKKVKKNYFTGPVTLRDVSSITKPNEHDLYHVTFKKSARTKIHYHTGAQMLIVQKVTGALFIIEKLVMVSQNLKFQRPKLLV